MLALANDCTDRVDRVLWALSLKKLSVQPVSDIEYVMCDIYSHKYAIDRKCQSIIMPFLTTVLLANASVFGRCYAIHRDCNCAHHLFTLSAPQAHMGRCSKRKTGKHTRSWLWKGLDWMTTTRYFIQIFFTFRCLLAVCSGRVQAKPSWYFLLLFSRGCQVLL